MVLFISGGELVFVFFIVLLVFGADRIPSIARGLAKGMTQVRQATNEIKSEIQKNTKFKDPSKTIKNLESKNYTYLHTVVKDNISKLAVVVSLETREKSEKIDLFTLGMWTIDNPGRDLFGKATMRTHLHKS